MTFEIDELTDVPTDNYYDVTGHATDDDGWTYLTIGPSEADGSVWDSGDAAKMLFGSRFREECEFEFEFKGGDVVKLTDVTIEVSDDLEPDADAILDELDGGDTDGE